MTLMGNASRNLLKMPADLVLHFFRDLYRTRWARQEPKRLLS